MPSTISGDANVSATEFGYLDGVTSALQTQINGKLTTPGAWTSYTPTVGQNNASIAKTVNYAKYTQIGKLVIVQVAVSFTAAGTTNTPVYATLPIAAASAVSYAPNGAFLYEDAGTAFYAGTAGLISDTSTVYFWVHNSGNSLGHVPTFAVANGDKLSFSMMYEVA